MTYVTSKFPLTISIHLSLGHYVVDCIGDCDKVFGWILFHGLHFFLCLSISSVDENMKVDIEKG